MTVTDDDDIIKAEEFNLINWFKGVEFFSKIFYTKSLTYKIGETFKVSFSFHMFNLVIPSSSFESWSCFGVKVDILWALKLSFFYEFHQRLEKWKVYRFTATPCRHAEKINFTSDFFIYSKNDGSRRIWTRTREFHVYVWLERIKFCSFLQIECYNFSHFPPFSHEKWGKFCFWFEVFRFFFSSQLDALFLLFSMLMLMLCHVLSILLYMHRITIKSSLLSLNSTRLNFTHKDLLFNLNEVTPLRCAALPSSFLPFYSFLFRFNVLLNGWRVEVKGKSLSTLISVIIPWIFFAPLLLTIQTQFPSFLLLFAFHTLPIVIFHFSFSPTTSFIPWRTCTTFFRRFNLWNFH